MPRSWPPPWDLRGHPQRRLAPHIQRADALGAVDLVRRQACQIETVALYIERYLAGALRRIGVEYHAALPAQAADGGNVVDRADLVVGMHHGDQHGVVAKRGRNRFRRHDPRRIRLDIGDVNALFGQIGRSVQNRLVLVAGGDQVAPTSRLEHALEGQVIGLSGPGRPHDGAWVRADQCGHLRAGLFHQLGGIPTVDVRGRGGIAEVAIGQQATAHLLRDAGIHRRGGGVVQIDHAALCVRVRHRGQAP